MFKEGDIVVDTHPQCKVFRVGVIEIVLKNRYGVKFPDWKFPVNRAFNYVTSLEEVQNIMKEIL